MMDFMCPMVCVGARHCRSAENSTGRLTNLFMTFKENTMSATYSVARVSLVDRSTATGSVRTVLDQIHGAFGATPHMFRAVANSPAALQSMWAAFGALGGGVIGAALGEQIAVAVANRNACDYCLAAHTALGRKAGVSGDD